MAEEAPRTAPEGGCEEEQPKASEDEGYQIPNFAPGVVANLHEDMLKMRAMGSQYKAATNGIEPQRLFLMRHGERIDFTFGTWVPHCFDEAGKYIRKDLNMPESVPERSQGSTAYIRDSPLTKVGIFQAKIVGEALKEKQIDIAYAYSSPSFRCIQTCDAFLRGCSKRDEVKIRIEPGLFEWTFWYQGFLPDWMTTAELVKAGYNIDEDYKPLITETKLRETKETCEQFYKRNTFVTKRVLDAHPSGNVVLVGHSCTLEVCSRELIGKKPRTADAMTNIIQKLPFCSLIQLTQEGEKWEITEPPCPPITHRDNGRFDYTLLLN